MTRRSEQTNCRVNGLQAWPLARSKCPAHVPFYLSWSNCQIAKNNHENMGSVLLAPDLHPSLSGSRPRLSSDGACSLTYTELAGAKRNKTALGDYRRQNRIELLSRQAKTSHKTLSGDLFLRFCQKQELGDLVPGWLLDGNGVFRLLELSSFVDLGNYTCQATNVRSRTNDDSQRFKLDHFSH